MSNIYHQHGKEKEMAGSDDMQAMLPSHHQSTSCSSSCQQGHFCDGAISTTHASPIQFGNVEMSGNESNMPAMLPKQNTSCSCQQGNNGDIEMSSSSSTPPMATTPSPSPFEGHRSTPLPIAKKSNHPPSLPCPSDPFDAYIRTASVNDEEYAERFALRALIGLGGDSQEDFDDFANGFTPGGAESQGLPTPSPSPPPEISPARPAGPLSSQPVTDNHTGPSTPRQPWRRPSNDIPRPWSSNSNSSFSPPLPQKRSSSPSLDVYVPPAKRAGLRRQKGREHLRTNFDSGLSWRSSMESSDEQQNQVAPLDSSRLHYHLALFQRNARPGDIWRLVSPYMEPFSHLDSLDTERAATQLGVSYTALSHYFVITKRVEEEEEAQGEGYCFECVTLTTVKAGQMFHNPRMIVFCKEQDCPGLSLTKRYCSDGQWRFHCVDRPWESKEKDGDTTVYTRTRYGEAGQYARYRPEIQLVRPMAQRVARVTDETLRHLIANAAPVYKPHT